MLNGITRLNLPQPQPPQRAQQPYGLPDGTEQTDQFALSVQSPQFAADIQKTARPGTLYIIDGFAQKPPSLSLPGPFAVVEHVATHGEMVQQAAREIGFQGPIVAIESDWNLSSEELNRRYAHVEPWLNDQTTPEQLSETLDNRLVARRVNPLDLFSANLAALAEAGVKSSVVNISAGTSQACSLESEFNSMFPDHEDPDKSVELGQPQRIKMALAMGIPKERIESEDPAVFGPLLDEVLVKLTERIAQADQAPAYIQAKENYDTATMLLVGQGNSVVVASGNEGETAQTTTSFLLSGTLPINDQFQVNDLTNRHTVIVGAMDKDKLAEYSCSYPSVRFYAQGGVDGKNGTSFATPRLGAVLAQLHADNPAARSTQLQRKLSQHYTIPMENGLQLDQTACRNYLLAS